MMPQSRACRWIARQLPLDLGDDPMVFLSRISIFPDVPCWSVPSCSVGQPAGRSTAAPASGSTSGRTKTFTVEDDSNARLLRCRSQG